MNLSDFPLLPDKVRVPRAGRGLIARPRVVGALDNAFSLPVALVTGPAGAGKTTAVRQWADTKHEAVSWLTLDSGDREPRRLWAGVLAALHVTRPPLPRQPGPGEYLGAAALTALVAVIGEPATPVTLILDDVHELAASPAEAELAFLLRHAPAGLRVVLCGRFAPDADLARLRLDSQLAEVDGADLACTPRETGELLAELSADPDAIMTQAERERVQAITGGWVAGVRLTALGEGTAAYLREQVLAKLTPDAQRFLLRTSVTGTLTAELANLLAGGTGAARRLEELRAHNYLVEADGLGYRYHPMLRDMLSEQLRRAMPETVPVLLSRAARWHSAHGHAVEAVRCHVEAGDWDSVPGALEESSIAGALTGDLAALERLLNRFPGAPGWVRRPPVAAALAAARLADDDAAGAEGYLRGADTDTGVDTDAGVGTDGDLSLIAVGIMSGRDPATGETLAATARPATLAQRRALGALWYALATALLRHRRLADASAAFDHAVRELGPLALGQRAQGWQAICLALSGDLRGADALVAALADAPDRDVARLARLAAAQLALDRDDPAAAETLARQVASGLEHAIPGEPDVTALARRVGDDAGVAAGRAVSGHTRWPLLAIARQSIATGDPQAALRSMEPYLDVPTVRVRIEALLVAAVAHRRLGQHAQAVSLLERALAIAEPHDAIRPFLDGGPPVHAAVSVLVPPRSAGAAFAARVLERFASTVPSGSGTEDEPVKLTESELAVVRMLPSQLTYQEMAGELFLSVNTVKTHLRLAYRKLGVNSRRAAIARARGLGLLFPAGRA